MTSPISATVSIAASQTIQPTFNHSRSETPEPISTPQVIVQLSHVAAERSTKEPVSDKDRTIQRSKPKRAEGSFASQEDKNGKKANTNYNESSPELDIEA